MVTVNTNAAIPLVLIIVVVMKATDYQKMGKDV
jgi:hypothetical protein